MAKMEEVLLSVEAAKNKILEKIDVKDPQISHIGPGYWIGSCR